MAKQSALDMYPRGAFLQAVTQVEARLDSIARAVQANTYLTSDLRVLYDALAVAEELACNPTQPGVTP